MIYTKDNPKLVNDVFNFRGIKTFTEVVKDKDGDIVYYLNGEYHREDGPAIELHNGGKEWWLNGKTHREDGPAVESAHGGKYWWLNNNFYGANDDFTNESWIRFVKLELLK